MSVSKSFISTPLSFLTHTRSLQKLTVETNLSNEEKVHHASVHLFSVLQRQQRFSSRETFANVDARSKEPQDSPMRD